MHESADRLPGLASQPLDSDTRTFLLKADFVSPAQCSAMRQVQRKAKRERSSSLVYYSDDMRTVNGLMNAVRATKSEECRSYSIPVLV